ncbi:MAG TPA: hypothetical protein VFE07_09790, partial [Marmoricola sp.]|nr:hypothetical protein [Marmoricola sp.]
MTLAPRPGRHTMTGIATCIAVAALVAGCGGPGRRDSSPGDRTRSPASTAATLAVGPPLATYVDPDRLVLYIHGVAMPGTWG